MCNKKLLYLVIGFLVGYQFGKIGLPASLYKATNSLTMNHSDIDVYNQTDVLQTDSQSLASIVPSFLYLESHLPQHPAS